VPIIHRFDGLAADNESPFVEPYPEGRP
jgi:hypothetical protein